MRCDAGDESFRLLFARILQSNLSVPFQNSRIFLTIRHPRGVVILERIGGLLELNFENVPPALFGTPERRIIHMLHNPTKIKILIARYRIRPPNQCSLCNNVVHQSAWRVAGCYACTQASCQAFAYSIRI